MSSPFGGTEDGGVRVAGTESGWTYADRTAQSTSRSRNYDLLFTTTGRMQAQTRTGRVEVRGVQDTPALSIDPANLAQNIAASNSTRTEVGGGTDTENNVQGPDYVSVTPAWTDGALSGTHTFDAATGDEFLVSSPYTHNVFAQSFTVTEFLGLIGDFYIITYSGTPTIAADATEYGTLAEAVAAAKAAIAAAQS